MNVDDRQAENMYRLLADRAIEAGDGRTLLNVSCIEACRQGVLRQRLNPVTIIWGLISGIHNETPASLFASRMNEALALEYPIFTENVEDAIIEVANRANSPLMVNDK